VAVIERITRGEQSLELRFLRGQLWFQSVEFHAGHLDQLRITLLLPLFEEGAGALNFFTQTAPACSRLHHIGKASMLTRNLSQLRRVPDRLGVRQEAGEVFVP